MFNTQKKLSGPTSIPPDICKTLDGFWFTVYPFHLNGMSWEIYRKSCINLISDFDAKKAEEYLQKYLFAKGFIELNGGLVSVEASGFNPCPGK